MGVHVLDEALGGGDRFGSAAQQRGDLDLDGGVDVFVHLGDEAESLGHRRIHHAGIEERPPSIRRTHSTHHVGTDVRGAKAEAHLGEGEAGRRHGERHVAHCDHPNTSPERLPVHAGDREHGEHVEAAQQGRKAGRALDPLFPSGIDLLLHP